MDSGRWAGSNPDTVLAPDVSFVAAGRVWPDEGAGWPAMAPDHAVEVLSPGTTRAEIALKVEIFLAAGVRLAWMADPEARTVTVHAPGRAPRGRGAGRRGRAAGVPPAAGGAVRLRREAG